MRAEDLFEAMGELDEELIARSGRRVKGHSEEQRRRRQRHADLYRFVIVAFSTAAAVFLILIAKDFIGTRGAQNTRGSQLLTNEQEAETDRAAEETVLAGEAREAEAAADAGEAPAAGEALKAAEASGAEESPKTEESSKTEEAPGAEENPKASRNLNAEEADRADEAQEIDETEEIAAEAENEESGEADRNSADMAPQEGAKAAIDLMGEYKGDYVALEYISAEDAANGGETTVPEYTKEGEEILSRAFANGKAMPSMAANTGEPSYFVYLTRQNGKVDTITFYELAYVSMTNYPGFVMKISQADYDEVMTLFR